MKSLGEKISRRASLRRTALIGGALSLPALLPGCKTPATDPSVPKVFRAGASAIDVTPKKFPIAVNGMLQNRVAFQVFDPLYVRCLILDDGMVQLAIVMCDSLLLPTELVDAAKAIATEATGIPSAHMLIAATHTHSAPSVAPIFQSEPDAEYRQFLIEQIVAAIVQAKKNLTVARVGWAVARDATQTYCRLWITRKPVGGPFGAATDRILMHPGYQNPAVIEPAGPSDPALTLLSVQTPAGQPIALLANYTMHYAEDQPYLSGDYFGYFARKMQDLAGAKTEVPFVAMMSNGAAGDAHCFDYRKPKQPRTRESVAESLAQAAFAAWKKIEHQDWVSLGARERSLDLEVRHPSDAEAVAARALLANVKERPLKDLPSIYARETSLLADYPKAVGVKVQALSVGGFGIVALPVEAYAITGLLIKRQSPFKPTCVIGLANGYHGYMPPPEHHLVGGYSTWRARSSYLAADAAPKVVELARRLLRELAGNAPRSPATAPGMSPYSRAIFEAAPLAYWPLNELAGPRANDVTDNGNHGSFEGRILFHLDGPPPGRFPGLAGRARAAYFFRQRMKARVSGLHAAYSIEFWFCNRQPFDEQTLAAYLFARGGGGLGDYFGIGGTSGSAARLFFLNGNSRENLLNGKTDVMENRWYHVTLVRDGEAVRAFLDGALEFTANAVPAVTREASQICIGGHSDNISNFEGKICQAALFARALSPDEITARYAIATKRS